MKEIKPGLKGKKELLVEEKDLASFSGNIGADVLSTPRVVLLMEQAARNAIEGLVPEDKITVGTMIKMKHFAATPLGTKVRAEAVLKEVDGRRLCFDITVYDNIEKISEGENEQVMVSLDNFVKKAIKKQRAAQRNTNGSL